MKASVILIWAAVLAASCLFFTVSRVEATGDTVVDVQSSASAAISDATDIRDGVAQAATFFSQLQTDPTFNANFLAALNGNNLATVQSLLSQRITTGPVTVRKLDITHSFLLEFQFKTRKGKIVDVCFSSLLACGKNQDKHAGITVE